MALSLRPLLLLALSMCPVLLAQAQGSSDGVLYRYVDSRGVTVLDRQGVPPEYIGKGYDILNPNGRVIQTVKPVPTAEEQQRLQLDKQQADANAELLQRYPSLEALDQAKARKRRELDAAIGSIESKLQFLASRQGELQAQAASEERAGRQVPAQLLGELDRLGRQQSRLKADIAQQQAAQGLADQDFAASRLRLEPLLQGR